MIDRETFELIRRKHGVAASWAVWGDEGEKPTSNMSDLGVLDPDKNPSLLDTLQPNVIMIGLNLARPVEDQPAFRNFHDPSPHAKDFKIRFAFSGTPYYGAYMTDLIKNHVEVDSGVVGKSLKATPELIERSIREFRHELNDLKADKPIIFAFGVKVHELLSRHLDRGEFAHLIKLGHYSDQISKENYRAEVIGRIEAAGLPAKIGEGQVGVTEKQWDVFVSYKSGTDREAAFDLVTALENAGIKCWIAPRDVTATTQIIVSNGQMKRAGYDDAIPFAIEQSRAMAVVVSREAMESDHIKDEINLGKDARIPFFPVRVEDIPLIGSFKYHLGRAQWNDCFSGMGSQRFLNVAAEIAGFLGVAARTKAFNEPAAKPVAETLPEADLRCRACGGANPAGARFCQECGIRLDEESTQEESAESPSDAAVTDVQQPSGEESGLKPADQLRLDYWTQLLALASTKSALHARAKPAARAYVQVSHAKGCVLRYACNAEQSEVGLYIDFSSDPDRKQKNSEAFQRLLRDREAIEARFGGSLDWQDNPDTIACLICAHIEGGTKSPREHWPTIHAAMVDAMIRLHGALPSNMAGGEL